MIHLLRLNHLWEPLRLFAQQKPVLGVCAGAILLAKNVTGPEQDSLQALDIDVARNAYGRQVDSFSALLTPVKDSPFEAIEGIFIRAPRISRVGTGVKTLLQHQGEPVLVEQGKVLAGTFHPELTDSLAVHHYFTTKCESESAAWTTDSQKSYELSSIN